MGQDSEVGGGAPGGVCHPLWAELVSKPAWFPRGRGALWPRGRLLPATPGHISAPDTFPFPRSDVPG
eukprot:15794342-Heterocapsa_arctica.AAC.1